jgi:hypothetical protein
LDQFYLQTSKALNPNVNTGPEKDLDELGRYIEVTVRIEWSTVFIKNRNVIIAILVTTASRQISVSLEDMEA